MSYNLLLDTNFKKLDKHWKLTNCTYNNGYLVSNAKIFSIEQEIILPDPTKLYFRLEYVCFDQRIKKIYCGIQSNNVLEVCVRKPRLNRRKKISVVDRNINQERIKVKFIIEATEPNAKIYIDNPILIDLSYHEKELWPKWFLDKLLDYRAGYFYENVYKKGSEISIDNEDFYSATTQTEEAKTGIIMHVTEPQDWFNIDAELIPNTNYLLKLDYEQLNTYGSISAEYGEYQSIEVNSDQLYLVFKANTEHNLRVIVNNPEALPYLVNLKHLLLVNLDSELKIDADDIPHLPFI